MLSIEVRKVHIYIYIYGKQGPLLRGLSLKEVYVKDAADET